MFGNDRNQIRQFYFTVWEKKKSGQLTEGLEQIVATVIDEHPEYHDLLNKPDNNLDRDWTPEQGQTNPFLHMGMHISIQEQLGSNRPPQIRELYQKMLGKFGNAHEVEHQMIECLGFAMWQAQATGKEPDLNQYLDCIRKLAGVNGD